MADPIAIIGLVAGVVTFVDFGFKVVAGSSRIRASASGMTAEIAELDLIIKDIRKSNIAIKDSLKGSHKISEDEIRILSMVKESESLYTQLRNTISKLEVRSDARSKTMESVRVALQSRLKQSELENLADRLNKLDRRIRDNLVFALHLQQHSSIMSKLKTMQSSQDAHGINHESKLTAISNQITDMMKEKEVKERNMLEEKRKRDELRDNGRAANHGLSERREKESLSKEEKDELISFQRAQLASLKTKLEVLQKEHSTSVTYVRVVESLYFPEVRRRFAQIPWADQRSNAWVFNPALTSFGSWLESTQPTDGVFYIFGKAGSGKSTLMKYLSENERTLSSLKQWAGTSDLYVASYYFWNQGNEMQKSRIGLMQSLLYQVLRSAPQLIPSVCRERLQHEAWELSELIATFERIARDTKLVSKFCFFIDGLDECDGNEHEVLPMLEILSACPHIKVCASSRPGRIYEPSLLTDQRAFDIARFTREDMQQYVLNQLTSSEKFQTLAAKEPGCQELIADISHYADGVWLWVFLVTRDIVHEVDRDEPLSTLRKIVDEFPADLEKYFQRIIGNIKDIHKEEMARTFLVTTHELQPLPLYAFALLNRERLDPDYALRASIQADLDDILKDRSQYALWRNRVQNRCGDLLVIVGYPEESVLGPLSSFHRQSLPALLTDSVDFLHRTVRDFLRDSFHDDLQRHLKSDYSPLLSLCRISLSLLKAVQLNNIRHNASANRMIALTDELLYYAYEVERMGTVEHANALVPLLKELDQVNSYYGRGASNHWTHVRDSPPAEGLDEYREEGNCNFLALAVQARLVNFVSSELEADPRLIKKQGRPLLDYALRPRRVTPISMPYHSDRDDPSVNIDMVEMLISHGADPNEAVYAYDDESVWKLFLISIFETTERASFRSIPENLKTAWYKAAEALVKAGAQSDRNGAFVQKRVADRLGGTDFVLDSVFGAPAARKLKDIIEMRAHERDEESKVRCAVM